MMPCFASLYVQKIDSLLAQYPLHESWSGNFAYYFIIVHGCHHGVVMASRSTICSQEEHNGVQQYLLFQASSHEPGKLTKIRYIKR